MVIDLFESASDRNDDRPTWAADARKRRFRAADVSLQLAPASDVTADALKPFVDALR